MGFPENEFISLPAKFGFLSYLTLKAKFINKQADGITDFIGNVLALTNNMGASKIDYNNRKLKKLEKISPSLFLITKRFDESWTNSNDLDITISFKSFDEELNEWLITNRINTLK